MRRKASRRIRATMARAISSLNFFRHGSGIRDCGGRTVMPRTSRAARPDENKDTIVQGASGLRRATVAGSSGRCKVCPTYSCGIRWSRICLIGGQELVPTDSIKPGSRDVARCRWSRASCGCAELSVMHSARCRHRGHQMKLRPAITERWCGGGFFVFFLPPLWELCRRRPWEGRTGPFCGTDNGRGVRSFRLLCPLP